MANETGILFGSVLFYAFIGMMFSIGGADYLLEIDEITISQPIEAELTGIPLFDFFIEAYTNLANFITVISVILINPFSSIGFLSWLSIALMIINIYIIARLVRGGG